MISKQSDSLQSIQNINQVSSKNVKTSDQFSQATKFDESEYLYQYIGPKLLFAVASIIVSQKLTNSTIIYRIISNLTLKKQFFSDTGNEDLLRKLWLKDQLSRITYKMIKYNSIIFCTKILLDQHYKEIIKKNKDYYQSNTFIHYKIGAMVGLIGYFLNLPISEYNNIKTSFPSTFEGQAIKNKYSSEGFKRHMNEFISLQTFKRVVKNINFLSLSSVIMHRAIYFGSYEKIKSKHNHPLNEYLIAPVLASTLCLVVSPLDLIRYLQTTSHKDKNFVQILHEKGAKLLSLPKEKISATIIKQSASMMFFVAGQNLARSFIKMKRQY